MVMKIDGSKVGTLLQLLSNTLNLRTQPQGNSLGFKIKRQKQK